MRQMRDGLTTGDLAERSMVSRDTLRFYERKNQHEIRLALEQWLESHPR